MIQRFFLTAGSNSQLLWINHSETLPYLNTHLWYTHISLSPFCFVIRIVIIVTVSVLIWSHDLHFQSRHGRLHTHTQERLDIVKASFVVLKFRAYLFLGGYELFSFLHSVLLCCHFPFSKATPTVESTRIANGSQGYQSCWDGWFSACSFCRIDSSRCSLVEKFVPHSNNNFSYYTVQCAVSLPQIFNCNSTVLSHFLWNFFFLRFWCFSY